MNGAKLIEFERTRQVIQEGWTPEHDDSHTEGELAAAAAAYAWPGWLRTRDHRNVHRHLLWPWAQEGWKPSHDRVRELVKAGALIAAEIDRLQRRADDSARDPVPGGAVHEQEQAR